MKWRLALTATLVVLLGLGAAWVSANRSTVAVPSDVVSISAGDVSATSRPDSGEGEGKRLGPPFHIGGQARYLQSLVGITNIDPNEKLDKTINIDILRDENFDYYFSSDVPLEVPAGGRVKFIVNNTHFTADECW